mmetsp:Transcript_13912/g.29703  ORF Transcript_13912/g.29703 Transcript_13912/m.29703 type:complete len:101 (-) Transcript_13912:62-364(-)
MGDVVDFVTSTWLESHRCCALEVLMASAWFDAMAELGRETNAGSNDDGLALTRRRNCAVRLRDDTAAFILVYLPFTMTTMILLQSRNYFYEYVMKSMYRR